jgi:hypothetical protein
MSWASTTLSTLNSIAKYESEVNQLAGQYTMPTLTMSAGAKVYFSPGFSSIDLTALYYDGTTEVGVFAVGTNTFDFTTGGECVQISETGTPYIFPTTQGSGDIYDTTGVQFIDISLSTGLTWNNAIVQYTWQNKITVAKTIIGNYLLTMLGKLGYTDDQLATGDTYLNYLDNTESLSLASDYKTLEGIYQDLSYKATNEVYERKIQMYADLYNKTIQDALYQLQFTTGSVPTYLFSSMGHLQV